MKQTFARITSWDVYDENEARRSMGPFSAIVDGESLERDTISQMRRAIDARTRRHSSVEVNITNRYGAVVAKH